MFESRIAAGDNEEGGLGWGDAEDGETGPMDWMPCRFTKITRTLFLLGPCVLLERRLNGVLGLFACTW